MIGPKLGLSTDATLIIKSKHFILNMILEKIPELEIQLGLILDF